MKLDKLSKKISTALKARECSWTASQMKKHSDRIMQKIKKAEAGKDYIRKLLVDCKSWGGPATTEEELHNILSGKDDQQRILRTEMLFYAHTHKANRIVNKELCRVNSITFEEMLENLTILLSEEKHVSTATIANLPSNADVMKALNAVHHTTEKDNGEDKVNKLYAVVWKDTKGQYDWFLGYVKKSVNDLFLVDHLTRVLKNSDSKWKYPTREDVQLIEPDQIVECAVEGEWDLTAISRKRCFTLEILKQSLMNLHNIYQHN